MDGGVTLRKAHVLGIISSWGGGAYLPPLSLFAGWLSECTASHTAQNYTLWSNVEYFHHKVPILLLCGVACSLTTNLQSTIVCNHYQQQITTRMLFLLPLCSLWLSL